MMMPPPLADDADDSPTHNPYDDGYDSQRDGLDDDDDDEDNDVDVDVDDDEDEDEEEEDEVIEDESGDEVDNDIDDRTEEHDEEEEEEEESSQDLQTATTTRTRHHPTRGGGVTAHPTNPAHHSHRPPRDYHNLRIKSTPTLKLLTDPELSLTVREIGRTASWSLSTAKPGNGVDQLRDSSLDTYWQSDGLQPHHINIQFPRRQTISAIALYLDFTLDESYTPKRMKIRVGTTFHNLEEVRTVDVREPCGWVTIPLWRKWGEDVFDNILDPHGDDDEGGAAGGETKDGMEDEQARSKSNRVPVWKRKPMRTHLVQISILSMHQNGRDTHVRQVKVFGPRDYGGGNGIGMMVGQNPSHHGLLHHRGGGVGGGSDGKRSGETTMMMTSGKLTVPAFQTVGMSQFSMIR